MPRPDAPPSNLVRAAQARLVAQLHQLNHPHPLGERDVSPTLPIDGRATPETATPWPGPLRAPAEAVDDERYEFGEVFAAGGLGLIRKARDRRLGRTIAVKELQRSDPAAERRFTLEAAITARLQHPGIVPLYDIGRYPTGEPYYCMKLIDGLSLEHHIRRCKSLPERLALVEHLIAAADAIAFAHRNNIIHRDLKPANILIGELGETVVIDWGLAKDLGGAIVDEVPDLPAAPPGVDSTMTQHGTMLGTLRYMPPEQARGLPADARSDVFALGAVLHHILTGAPPHAELDDRRLVALVSEGAVSDLAALVPDAPRELVAIAARAMAPRPEQRYASAEALVDDLRRFRTGRLVGAHRYATAEVLRLWLRRHRSVVVVASAALVALTTVTGLAVQRIRHQRDAATVAQAEAEAAEDATAVALAAARERANAALLAQVRGDLDDDLAGALATLARVDLSDEAAAREVHLLAHAAASRGAPARVLSGPPRPIDTMVAASDGGLIGVDVGGEVWRWDPRSGDGARVLDLAERGVAVIAAAKAPVFAAIGSTAAHVVHADGRVQVVDLSDLSRGTDAAEHYAFALSADGGVLAALGQPAFNDGHAKGAAAYRWDLRVDRPVREQAPHERAGEAVLSPDGREIAYQVADGPAVVLTDGVTTPMPGLRRPLGFSSDGRQVYGFPFGKPPHIESFNRDTGEMHHIGRWVLAAAPGGAALTLDFDDFVGSAIVSLRDLATGEQRWRHDIERSTSLSQWGAHAEFDVAIDPRGLGLAIRTNDQWLLGDLATGKIDRSLDIGHHPRGTWLADGGFVVAHNTQVWAWDPVERAAIHDPVVVSSDGSRAIVAGAEVRVADLSSGTASESACLAGIDLEQLAEPRHTLAVDGGGRVLYAAPTGEVCVAAAGGPAHRVAREPLAAADDGATAGGPEELAVLSRAIGRAGPRKVTAVALGAGEQFAVGRLDGEVATWARPGAEPRRHQLGAPVFDLTAVGAGYTAVTAEAVFVVREDGELRELVRVPTNSLQGRRMYKSAVAVHPQGSAVVVVVPGQEALYHHDFASDRTQSRDLELATSALAYSPAGHIAVAVAGRGVQVLESIDDPGRVLALPEEARSLVFVGDERLAVVGDRGSLICVDVVGGAAVVCKRGFAELGGAKLYTQASGAVYGHNEFANLGVFSPADTIPHDIAALGEWLQARRAALAGD